MNPSPQSKLGGDALGYNVYKSVLFFCIIHLDHPVILDMLYYRYAMFYIYVHQGCSQKTDTFLL